MAKTGPSGKSKGKFTQTNQKPDAFVTQGQIEHPIQAFGEGITGGGLPIMAKGYGDNDQPGRRNINFQRKLGATEGPGALQRFIQKKTGK